MKLSILTPSQAILPPTEVQELQATGPQGEFGVLAGHADYAVPLGLGLLSYQDEQGRQKLVTKGGYLEVHAGEVLVVADSVESAKDLDAEFLKKDLAQLEKRLSGEALSPEDFQSTLEARDETAARLRLFE